MSLLFMGKSVFTSSGDYVKILFPFHRPIIIMNLKFKIEATDILDDEKIQFYYYLQIE